MDNPYYYTSLLLEEEFLNETKLEYSSFEFGFYNDDEILDFDSFLSSSYQIDLLKLLASSTICYYWTETAFESSAIYYYSNYFSIFLGTFNFDDDISLSK